MARKTMPAQSRGTVGQRAIAALTQLHDALQNGQPLKSQFSVTTLEIPDPPRWTARQVKALRARLGISQGVFAQMLGVSRELVEHWEQGVRSPKPLACRVLQMLSADPAQFIGYATRRAS